MRNGDVSRVLPLEDFFIAYGKQDRAPGEYVRRIHAPRLKANQRYRSFKVSKRFDEDISAVMSAFRFTLDGRRIVEARIAYGGMAATPKRASNAEKALIGADLDDPDELERRHRGDCRRLFAPDRYARDRGLSLARRRQSSAEGAASKSPASKRDTRIGDLHAAE